ncbi:MAG: hypothetical protein WA190_17645 [Usitatibacter sp.]
MFLRLGSHAEKDYFEKAGKGADGIILGANLVESTPGATASLVVKLGGDKMLGSYYIDPMTYAFGEYFDPETSSVRTDLAWIKSLQKDKKTKKTVLRWKKSYFALAAAYGGVFEQALSSGKAIMPAALSTDALRSQTADAVIKYQLNRLRDEFASDPEYAAFADEIPPPAALFAPYFYIEPHDADALLTLNIALAKAASTLGYDVPVHAVLCADLSFLTNAALTARLVSELATSGVKGIWLWFSRFYEEKASAQELDALVDLVRVLADKVEVYNMHGGFFSLCLSKGGLSGISHGVGYGEQKDVIPIIGQSTPTVRYYLPAPHVRTGIPAIESCFHDLGVDTADKFHATVCGCTICKGVLAGDLQNFKQFGETHFSMPTSKRLAQTPAAAKRCRFHFLLKRLEERDQVKAGTVASLQASMQAAYDTWAKFPTMKDCTGQLPRWKAALGKV